MSENASSIVKTNQTFLKKVFHQPLEKFFGAALIKLKNFWEQKNTYSGIQFFNDLDDLGK